MCLFFFFKQKTAYEMRISDWSSDVCSSDLRLIDFLDAHHEAIIAIAARADGNVEFHLRIGVIGLRLAQIPRDAAAADHRAREAPCQRVFLAHRRDVDVALLEDAVVDDQADRKSTRLNSSH